MCQSKCDKVLCSRNESLILTIFKLINNQKWECTIVPKTSWVHGWLLGRPVEALKVLNQGLWKALRKACRSSEGIESGSLEGS